MSEYTLELTEAEMLRYQKMAEAALSTERDMWTAAGIVEGARVADVGCGPGAISVLLAELVGPAGQVWAVDRGPEALEAAAAAARRAGIENMTVSAGDADDTGLAPASVDVVMIRHVLAHNGGREEAIVEHAASLLRPGGCVYLVDTDGPAVRIRPSDPDIDDLTDRYWNWHQGMGNDVSAGLRLGDLLAAAGLEVLHFSGRYQMFQLPAGLRPPSWAAADAMVTAGVASGSDVARWGAAFERIDAAAERPTIFAPMFAAYARRPVT